MANGKFVEAGGNREHPWLVASAEKMDDWSIFEVKKKGGKKISIRLVGNGRWLCAEWGQGSAVLVNRDHDQGW